MRTVINKLRKNRSGFSLGETLIVVLILLMVSAIVGGAIPTASNVFTKTVDAANAQLLLSTTLTELRDELSTASNIEVSGTTVTYRNGSGLWKIVLVEVGANTITIPGDTTTTKTITPGIWLCRAIAFNPETGAVTYRDPGMDSDNTRLLVSEKAATEKLAVSYTSITKIVDADNNILGITFNGISVKKIGSTNSLADRATFTVRRIA